MPSATDFHAYPDAHGHFGRHGGRFVAETLIGPLQELASAYDAARVDPAFIAAFDKDLKHYVGRPSPIYHAERLSREVGGAQILLKREDLNHTGAHKINNTIGQALLASRMGKKRIIAETGAGQHGVASATVATRLGLECVVYMGATDIERQKINVYRMKLLGATVVPVTSGSATLKDALNEAMRDWVTNVHDTFYIIGTVAGPDPYPRMVRDFNAVVGREARAQMLADYGRLPDAITACVGGGSNAIGIFSGFVDTQARLVGVEPAGGAAVGRGIPGVVHGMKSFLLQDEDGQVQEAHSISAGLDYPGVGPEHSYLASIGRAEYPSVTDAEVIEGFQLMSRSEGIIPALECAHVVAWIAREAPRMQGQTVLMNLSGRGDKDVAQMMQILGPSLGASDR